MKWYLIKYFTDEGNVTTVNLQARDAEDAREWILAAGKRPGQIIDIKEHV